MKHKTLEVSTPMHEVIKHLRRLGEGHEVTVHRLDGSTLTGPLRRSSDGINWNVGNIPLTNPPHDWTSMEWDEDRYPEWMNDISIWFLFDTNGRVWKRAGHLHWRSEQTGVLRMSGVIHESYGPLTPLVPKEV